MASRSLLYRLLLISNIFLVFCDDLVLQDEEMRCVEYYDGSKPCPDRDYKFEITKEPKKDGDEDGSYIFTFTTPVISCKTVNYSLQMIYHPNLSEEMCNDAHRLDDYKIISTLYFSLTSPDCMKAQAIFQYDYLYKGCFSISRDSFNYFWIDNKHTLNDFRIEIPTITCLNKNPPAVYIDFDKKSLHKNELNLDAQMYHRDLKNPEIFKLNCTRNNTNSYCSHDQVPDGNYTVKLKIQDDPRCYISNNYGYCFWNCSIEALLAKPSEHIQESQFAFPGGLLSIVIIFILCMTSLFGWIFYKNRAQKKRSQQTYDNLLCNGANCHVSKSGKVKGIYLVYARDCLPFMRVMENFRYVLKKMTGCKVYDVYDDAWFCDIAMSPPEWILSHIQDPDNKIVLVATECADRLYKNLLYYHRKESGSDEKYCRDLYLSPSYCDSFLTFSLKLLSFDVTPAPYHKIFVVRFPKFNKEKDYMTHVNPFKRYDMPENLEVLIDSIFHKAPVIIDDDDSVDSDDPMKDHRIGPKPVYTRQTFEDSVKELNEFFKLNPTYLMEDIMINEADIDPFEANATSLERSRTSIL